MPSWLSVEAALEKILGYVSVLEAEEKPLLDATGQVLAGDVSARFDVPSVANSAMDGYAVQFESIRGASHDSPKVLKVIGQLAAGQVPDLKVHSGAAIRIMTGAAIPPGADTVMPFEQTDELQRSGNPGQIGILAELPRGSSIRPAGDDIRRGQIVLTKGMTVTPAVIGVLASLGHTTALVVRRPVVAVLATGNELVDPGQPLPAGSIYNSNGYGLAASVARYGGIPKVLGIARDNPESLTAKVGEGLDADMLITSGGVSRGDYDIVKDILAQMGEIAFWTVRMRPAKPLAFGVLYKTLPDGVTKRVPHLGLPGNPVSSLAAFEEFGRAAILKMLGKGNLAKPTIEAVLETPIENTDGRRVFARVIVTRQNGVYYAKLAGGQGSHVLSSMARANGLAICPEDVPVKKAGEIVKVQMLDWPEEYF